MSGEKYSYATLLDMAKAAKPLQSFVDPDDSLFVAPDDMPRAIDEYCRKTEQPVPQTHGAYPRVVLESLALKYRYVLEQLGALTAVQFRNIRVIGGGCRNALLNQFTADATGCQVLAGPAEARELIERSFPYRTYEPADTSCWDRAFAQFTARLNSTV